MTRVVFFLFQGSQVMLNTFIFSLKKYLDPKFNTVLNLQDYVALHLKKS